MSLPAALVAALPFLHHAAATPDSAALAAERLTRAVESWHEFYLLAGTAAVTLVGLLFVALSFHLDTLVLESMSHLLAAARMAFLNFIFVLVLSLLFLIPNIPPSVLGAGVLTLSLTSLGYFVWNAFKARHRKPLTKHEQFLRRRFAIAGLVLGIGVVTAVSFMLDARRTHLLQFMTITLVMLVNAAGTSWDLLVQVGRLRLPREERPKA